MRASLGAAVATVLLLVMYQTSVRQLLPIGGIVSWETASPESCGIDGARLERLSDDLAEQGTEALLVARGGKIVHEWYAFGHGAWRLEGGASLAKSLVGGMMLLVALSDGLISLDDPAWWYIPTWADDSLKRQITVRHLATHSSGMVHGRDTRWVGWGRSFWTRQPDLFDRVLDEAPLSFNPGTAYQYSGPGYAALGYALTSAIKDTPRANLEALLRKRIMEPLGIPGSAWSISYGKSFESDSMELFAIWSGARYTTRAAARVGKLMLQKGRWGDVELVAPDWVQTVTHYSGTPLPDRSDDSNHPAPAICWWSNSLGAWPSLPRDAFAGAGARGQVLLVVPSLDLVVVRFGNGLGDESHGADLWKSLVESLFTPLARTLIDSPNEVGTGYRTEDSLAPTR